MDGLLEACLDSDVSLLAPLALLLKTSSSTMARLASYDSPDVCVACEQHLSQVTRAVLRLAATVLTLLATRSVGVGRTCSTAIPGDSIFER